MLQHSFVLSLTVANPSCLQRYRHTSHLAHWKFPRPWPFAVLLGCGNSYVVAALQDLPADHGRSTPVSACAVVVDVRRTTCTLSYAPCWLGEVASFVQSGRRGWHCWTRHPFFPTLQEVETELPGSLPEAVILVSCVSLKNT